MSVGVRTMRALTSPQYGQRATMPGPRSYTLVPAPSTAAEVGDEATGAFTNDDPTYLQSTGFVLDPDWRVVVSVYPSGAIGRLVPQDVIGLVRHGQARGATE